MIKDIAKLVP